MSTILYFAYGSNMHSARLYYRAPNSHVRFVAHLPRHRLYFHKLSADGSAKCNALFTGVATDAVVGVIYEIPTNEKLNLNRAEGLGFGYHEESLNVVSPDGEEIQVCTYIADNAAIRNNLKPYSWYKDFVLAGAEEHRLPSEYVDSRIRAVLAILDPDKTRERKRRAEIKA